MPRLEEFDDVQLDVAFTQANTRSNLTSNENIAISLGKISKWYEALVPTGGSSGQFLEWNSNGTAKWVSNPNVDTKVNVTLATTTKAYLLGTTTTPTDTATGVTSVADTGVYLTTTSGELCATKFTTSGGRSGYYAYDSNDRKYPLVYDNANNLWVGSESSVSYSHKGETFISAGWTGELPTTSGETLTGNSTIRVSVPKYTAGDSGGTWSHTAYYVLHSGNTSFTQSLSSGTKIGTININGTSTDIYCETNTDTKVTSTANHYTPATASGSDKSASASGATAAWSIDVVQGVTLNTDGKGHVTGISVTSGKIPAYPIPSNNVTGSGTSGYLTKWNGTNTITNGPQLGSSTTTFLRNDGTWQTPVDTKVNVIKDETSKAYLLATTATPTTTAQGVTSIADTGVYLETTAGCLHLNDTLYAKYVNATDTIYTYSLPTMGNFGGLSLYGGLDPRKVGIMNRKTSTYYGYHGYVTAFYATFLTVNTLDSGWIFKSSTSDADDPYEVGGNVASINTDGNAVFNGSVTVGGNAANTSGCRMQYNSTTESLDFVFA